MTFITQYASPLGEILLAGKDEGICGLWFKGQKYFPLFAFEDVEEKETPALRTAKNWLDSYFSGEAPDIDGLCLKPEGSAFRLEIWKLLCEIPYGQTDTYGNIAKKAAFRLCAEKISARAVGGAVGHNPISIIIPCHRVIGANGALTGYAGGIDIKRCLLAREGVDVSRLL